MGATGLERIPLGSQRTGNFSGHLGFTILITKTPVEGTSTQVTLSGIQTECTQSFLEGEHIAHHLGVSILGSPWLLPVLPESTEKEDGECAGGVASEGTCVHWVRSGGGQEPVHRLPRVDC